MSAKENILRKVRGALAATGHAFASDSVREKLSQHPRGPLPSMPWETLPRFCERCLSLSSTVDQVPGSDSIAAAVARYLATQTLAPRLVMWPEFAALDWPGAGVLAEVRAATGNDAVGLTGVFCAIAETGTLMLLSGAATPLVNSLLPETHIAVVPASRVVRSMEDAFDLLRREQHGLPRQVSFISGPSRTADIELTLVLGIHGPARVHVIIDQDS